MIAPLFLDLTGSFRVFCESI